MDILEVLIKALAAKSTFNGDISKWNTGTSDEYAIICFESASAFNQDIGSWNTGKVTL